MNLTEQIDAYYPELVAIRRRLHEHPELGTHEIETGKIIREYLDSWGIAYEYPVADTGIAAILYGEADSRGEKPDAADRGNQDSGGSEDSPSVDAPSCGRQKGNTVGLRADMDALPLTEQPDRTYCSQYPGVMHACGHDVHMTVALGTAKILSEIKTQWSGCVKFFFQPAEETVGGAQRMIEAGCMENPHVDYVAGLHVMPYYEAGHIEVKYDKLNASSDEVDIHIKGKSCHGAYPDNGVDAIVIAGSLITSLQTLVSRTISPLENAVLTLGKIAGGTAGNIMADEVTMTGTLRTTSPKIRQLAIDTITRQTEYICQAYGGQGTTVIKPGYNALINDNKILDLLLHTAEPILGKEHIHWKEFPSLGVEDFSFFLDHAPGVFYHLGCGNEEKGITAPIHNNQFDVDENCLKTGVRLQTELTLNLLKR